jgi:glycosyltransferase involved in cell wall biosynthesis
MDGYESAVVRFGGDKSADITKHVNSVHCLDFGELDEVTPILTIGIPVFNGKNAINRTLNSIYNALQFLPDIGVVQVVICDNASTDQTGIVIHEFFSCRKARGGYYRHQYNFGFDSNLDSIVKLAQGEYVWFVGCGDEVKPNAIKRLVEKLRGLSVPNLLLDFDRFGESADTVIQKREHAGNVDLIIRGRDDFHRPRYAPALSANVINREKWVACLGDNFTACGWGHVERILRMLSLDEKSETAILTNPFFSLFVDTNGWWTKPDGYKLHLEHIRVIQRMTEIGFTEGAKRSRLRELDGVVFIRSVIGSRKYGYLFSDEDMREIRDLCCLRTYLLLMMGLRIPLRFASLLFSECQGNALRLGFRKIYKRIFSEN